MKNLFNKYDIETIIKSMLIELNKLKSLLNDNKNDEDIVVNNNEEERNIEDNSLYKLIFQLYEIIKRKYEQDELIKMLFSIIKEYNESDNSNKNNEFDFETCFDWISNLTSSDSNVFENLNSFKKYFKILLSFLNLNCSPKIISFIEHFYNTFNENFISSFKEETENNKKILLSLLEQNKSPYYQEILNLNKLKSTKNTRRNSESKLNNTYNTTEEDYEELPKEIFDYILKVLNRI